MSTQNSFSLIELLKYFIYLGSCCFGGPIALVGHIQKDLVEKKNWYSNQEFQNALAFSKLTPGPFAVQLGMYLGYLRFKTIGATLILFAFVIPPSFIVLIISFFYVHYKSVTWIEAFLYGMSPAAISIIFKAATNLTKISIQKDKILWFLFFIIFLTSTFSKMELIVLIIVVGIIYMLFNKKTSASFSLLPIFEPSINLATPTITSLFIYFFSAGLLVFGSGLAIIPFLHDGVVEKYNWISEKEFIDAVSIGMVTPGPVLVCVTFIGYLINGLTGAIVSTLAVFLPVYFFVVFLSPVYNRFSENKDVKSFIRGVTASICGAIFASCFTLASKAIIDPQTFLIFLISAFCLTKLKFIPEPVIILVAGGLGILLK